MDAWLVVVLVMIVAVGNYGGTVQFFRGGMTGMGKVSLFVPFLGYVGWFSTPKPGSTRYERLDRAKQVEAESFWQSRDMPKKWRP